MLLRAKAKAEMQLKEKEVIREVEFTNTYQEPSPTPVPDRCPSASHSVKSIHWALGGTHRLQTFDKQVNAHAGFFLLNIQATPHKPDRIRMGPGCSAWLM